MLQLERQNVLWTRKNRLQVLQIRNLLQYTIILTVKANI